MSEYCAWRICRKRHSDHRLPNLETGKVSVKLHRKMAQELNKFNKNLEKEIRWRIDILNEIAQEAKAA
jgi:hypothetical protein